MVAPRTRNAASGSPTVSSRPMRQSVPPGVATLRGVLELRRPLLVFAVIAFVAAIGISIMPPLLPLCGLSLGASSVLVGLMTSGFAIANSVAQLVTLRHRAVRLATADPRRDGHVQVAERPAHSVRDRRRDEPAGEPIRSRCRR